MPDVRSLVRDLPSSDLVSGFGEVWILSWVARPAAGSSPCRTSCARTRTRDASATARYLAAPPRRLVWRGLRSSARILEHAIHAPLPWTERAELALAATGNFPRNRRTPPGDPRRVVTQLRREIAMLRRTCDERLALVERLDAECKARQRLIDELRGK